MRRWTFGQLLKELRFEARLTQKEVAAAAYIDVTYLSKLENDRLEPPAEGTILNLAGALDTDPDNLLLAARKVPKDVREIITSSRHVPAFLRAARDLTDKQWAVLFEMVLMGHIWKGESEEESEE